MLKFLILLFFLVSCKEESLQVVKEKDAAEDSPLPAYLQPDFLGGCGLMARIYPPKRIELSADADCGTEKGSCCKWRFAWRYNERVWEGEDYDGIILDSSSVLSKEEFMKGLALMSYPLTTKYNEYLDSNPKLKGKILLKFTIESDGSIVNDTILHSTTGNKKFDNEIRNVLHIPWAKKWEKNGKGATTAIIPITFFYN